MDPHRKRILFRFIKVFLLIYAVVGLLIYYLQDYIFLRPTTIPGNEPYNFSQPHKELNIPYRKDVNMSIVQFTTSQPVKGVVLYFHGNRGNVKRYARASELFTKNGYECWIIDYPGYGKSKGEFTEKEVYDWALTTYKLARARFSRDSIVIYGRSLGSGPASQLAAIRDCKFLVLETPYYDLPSLVSYYLPVYPVHRMIKYEFPVGKHLEKVTAPVFIFHGDDDFTIPISEASRLKESLKKGDEFIEIEDGEHNNLRKFDQYTLKIDSLFGK
jgi:alpha-beta hydrolase superfamily lysophospholipase